MTQKTMNTKYYCNLFGKKCHFVLFRMISSSHVWIMKLFSSALLPGCFVELDALHLHPMRQVGLFEIQFDGLMLFSLCILGGSVGQLWTMMCDSLRSKLTGWWQVVATQMFLVFLPRKLGKMLDPFWPAHIFSNGLLPPPTSGVKTEV